MEAERHLGLKGDVILCPGCRTELAMLYRYMSALPAGRIERTRRGRARLFCRGCGAGSVLSHGFHRGTGEIEDAIGPRVMVRSGAWTGWRALGGE